MRARPDRAGQGERVAKVIARAGLASRRQAEAWIAAGRVTVNGEAIRSPALNVTANDHIAVDGRPLPARERTRLFLHHKPRGLVTTHTDPKGRPTVFAALPKDLPRLISVGRLDIDTEGLLLLTNEGSLARALELPATGWLRRYRVRAHGHVRADQLSQLRQGITIDGIRYGAIAATLDRVQGSNVWLTFAMREGKNREVKNVLAHLGLQVNRLIRVSYGPFQLGELRAGAIEEVRTRTLRDQLGERMAAAAGIDFSGPIVRPPAPLLPPGCKAGCRYGTAPPPRPPARYRSRPHRRARARAEAKTAPAPGRPPQGAVMRIVGGRLRGRALAVPRSNIIRPTADRLRESIFNILVHAYGDPISGARTLDLFAGTGALGLEALSRGAAFVLFIDERPEARALIRENVAALGLGGVTRIFRRDAAKLGPAYPIEPFSMVFLDPPYGRGLAEPALHAARTGAWLAPDAQVVVEEAAQACFAAPVGFDELERRIYDDTEVIFLRAS